MYYPVQVHSTGKPDPPRLLCGAIIIVLIFAMVVLSSIFPVKIYADDFFVGIANYFPIIDSKVEDGDIVSFSPKGYYLSRTEYDSLIVGVVTNKPAISLEVSGPKKTYPVVSTGNSFVNVTTINGNITKSDPITTSKIPGAGMKATKSGYIIGAALESYASNNKRAVKKIPVNLSVHYFVAQQTLRFGLLDVLNLSTLATYEEPIRAFKYFVAAFTVVLSFIFAFLSFARTANKGLEALGRNPLASRVIQVGIFFNIAASIAIVFAGLVVAFIMIRL